MSCVFLLASLLVLLHSLCLVVLGIAKWSVIRLNGAIRWEVRIWEQWMGAPGHSNLTWVQGQLSLNSWVSQPKQLLFVQLMPKINVYNRKQKTRMPKLKRGNIVTKWPLAGQEASGHPSHWSPITLITPHLCAYQGFTRLPGRPPAPVSAAPWEWSRGSTD